MISLMKKFSLKNIALFVGIIGNILLFSSHNLYWSFSVPIDIAPGFIIFLPFLLFAIIGYFVKPRVFKSWLKFSAVWVPVNIAFFLFLARDSSGGWSAAGAGGGAVFILGIVLVYVLISIAIFGFGSLKKP